MSRARSLCHIGLRVDTPIARGSHALRCCSVLYSRLLPRHSAASARSHSSKSTHPHSDTASAAGSTDTQQSPQPSSSRAPARAPAGGGNDEDMSTVGGGSVSTRGDYTSGAGMSHGSATNDRRAPAAKRPRPVASSDRGQGSAQVHSRYSDAETRAATTLAAVCESAAAAVTVDGHPAKRQRRVAPGVAVGTTDAVHYQHKQWHGRAGVSSKMYEALRHHRATEHGNRYQQHQRRHQHQQHRRSELGYRGVLHVQGDHAGEGYGMSA